MEAARTANPVPDTTAPWRYYPLAVGNVWEYEEDDGALRRTTVEKDTVVLERQYFLLHNGLARDSEVAAVFRTVVRFDTASASVVSLSRGGWLRGRTSSASSTPHSTRLSSATSSSRPL